MKKSLIVSVIGLISVLIISGCSFNQIIDKVSPQAEGVILYGDEDTVNNDIDDNREGLKSSATYAIKINQDDKNKIMIMNKKTAKALVNKGLLRKINDDVENTAKTESIDALPKVTKDTSILFASKEVDHLEVGEKQYDVSYEGNVIIGDGRSYVDSFMVVDDAIWDTIDGEEKTVGVLHFDKEHNPKKKMIDFKAEKAQLISFDD